jgi:hypothetical protein
MELKTQQKNFIGFTFFALAFLIATTSGAQDTTALKAALLGRWELVKYSEQGLGVDKKQNALPQAQAVYHNIAKYRAKFYYGFDEDAGDRIRRAFERWVERDSLAETSRIIEAISTPFFAVFFPDSTMSVYNKDAVTGFITYPEARHYTFFPRSMSIHITNQGGYGIQWHAQVLLLTPQRMLLFLAEEGEVVELIKTAYTLP